MPTTNHVVKLYRTLFTKLLACWRKNTIQLILRVIKDKTKVKDWKQIPYWFVDVHRNIGITVGHLAARVGYRL